MEPTLLDPKRDPQQPPFRGRHRGSHGLIPGLILVVVGGVLLMRELGLLPTEVRLRDLWPLFIIGFGLAQLRHNRGVGGAFFSLAFATFGVFLLLGNLHLIAFPAASLWPVLLVLAGLAIIFGGRHHHRHHGWAGRHRGHGFQMPGSETSSADVLDRSVTMGGAEIRVESKQFKGGQLNAMMAGIELDLRNAELAPEGATLDIRAVMGGIEIRVPESWSVLCDVAPILGGVEDRTHTVSGVDERRRLRLTGSVVVGGLNIRN